MFNRKEYRVDHKKRGLCLYCSRPLYKGSRCEKHWLEMTLSRVKISISICQDRLDGLIKQQNAICLELLKYVRMPK